MSSNQGGVQVVSRDILASNIFFTEYTLKQTPSSPRLRFVLLLHGWMATGADLASVAHSLAESGYAVLTPDLPYHGKSIGVTPQSMTEAADMLFRALETLIKPERTPFPIAIIGYSLGGRLAFEMAGLSATREHCVVRVEAFVMISAAPAPRADVEEEREVCASVASRTSQELRDLDPTKRAFQSWLVGSWYDCSMWGSIAKAPGFKSMITSRVEAFDIAQRDAWCEAAIRLSRATMTEPPYKLDTPALYVCGVRDEKYVSWSAEIKWFLRNYQCAQIHDAGHNIVLEKRDILESCLKEFLSLTYGKPATTEMIDIHDVRILRYSLPLKKVMIVNNEAVAQREGVLVALSSRDGCFGVGDICPLPGLHEENLSTCINELSDFADRISESQPCLSFLSMIDPNSVLRECSPTTRIGIESAFLHLLSRSLGLGLADCLNELASAMEKRLCNPSPVVLMNGVLPRLERREYDSSNETTDRYQQYVSQSSFDTLKLKVGSIEDLDNEGLMVKEALIAASRCGKRVRLDANRAWTKEQFNKFLLAMQDKISDIDFIEEPFKSTDDLERYLGEFSDENSTIPVALDESLAMGLSDQVRRMAASRLCKALIVKPSVIASLRRLVDLSSFSLDSDCEIILSSSFECGVGLAWTSIFASVLGRNSSRHGLGTFSYLAQDMLSPSFATFCVDKESSRADVSKCETFIRLAAEKVMSDGVPAVHFP